MGKVSLLRNATVSSDMDSALPALDISGPPASKVQCSDGTLNQATDPRRVMIKGKCAAESVSSRMRMQSAPMRQGVDNTWNLHTLVVGIGIADRS
jgi:hypothetical protein